MIKFLRLITFAAIAIAVIAWLATLYGWLVTEPGFEPLNVLISAILSSLIALFGWIRTKTSADKKAERQNLASSEVSSATNFSGNVKANVIVTGGQNITVNDNLGNADKETPSPKAEISVKIFAVQETAHFINTPGRYSDQIKFTITNQGDTVESLKLKLTFPKLEKLIDENQFPSFRKHLNSTDFNIQENEDSYQITFRTQEALLQGDTLELERACIIYAMNLPDKDKWLKTVQNAQHKVSWQLFSNITEPFGGEQEIRELYIGNQFTVEQKAR